MEDAKFIKETLKLARKGQGWTNPNPMVGAVIVKNQTVIGRGYHHKAGLPHAEIEAIRSAKQNLNGATLYVNLEPCSTFGKTPPCVETIISAGISKVVCSALDPNPKNQGQGIESLKQAGIDVSIGVLEGESRSLNETFFTFHQKKQPFIALKFAASIDGKIATLTGDSKWITNEKARSFTRKLRAEYQAILVGINTVIADNPNLGISKKGQKEPLRVILDTSLKIPLKSDVLRDNNVLIATTIYADKTKKKQLIEKGIGLITYKSKQIDLKLLMSELYKREIISVFVEGGANVLGSFLDSGLVDKVYAFQAPILIGGTNAISAIAGGGARKIADAIRLKNVTHKKFGDNILTIGYAR